MKFNRIIYALAFTIAASLPLFGMMKKTSRLALPKAVLPQSLPNLVDFSQPEAPFFPTVATFPSYDYSGKTYWYKYPVIKLLKLMTAAFYAKQGYDFYKESAVLELSENAAEKDPELYKVFLKIKNDYGIAEDVSLRILKPLEDLPEKYYEKYELLRPIYYEPLATFDPFSNGIFLSPDYKLSPSQLVRVLAHELEHYRQHNKYPGSYYPRILYSTIFNSLEKDNKSRVRFEIGADAAAADYLYCWKCLDEVACNAHEHEPKETAAGYVTTREGYFSEEDYKIYQERAKEAKALCDAHKFKGGYNPFMPLEAFLPPIVK